MDGGDIGLTFTGGDSQTITQDPIGKDTASTYVLYRRRQIFQFAIYHRRSAGFGGTEKADV